MTAPLSDLEWLKRRRETCLKDLKCLPKIAATIKASHGIDTRDRALACNERQHDGALAQLAHLSRLIREREEKR